MTEGVETARLAEGRWLWRRLFVFAGAGGLWLLLRRAAERMEPQSLPRLADGLMALLALTLILYLVAPSAQQIVALVANLRLRLAVRP